MSSSAALVVLIGSVALAGCGGDDGGSGGSGGSGGGSGGSSGGGASPIGEPGTIWITQTSANTISSLDAQSLTVTATKDVASAGTEPTSIAAGADSVWFTYNGHDQLTRITPDGAVGKTDTLAAYDVALGEGAVWATVGAGVSRVDPATGSGITFVDTGFTQNSIAVGGGAVWVIAGQMLKRIDATTNAVVEDIDFQAGSSEPLQLPLTTLSYGEGAVWILGYVGSVSAGARILIKVDPATNAVVDRLDLATDGASDSVAAGLGSVWVSSSYGNKLFRIDPATVEIADEISLPGAQPEEIALGASIVWLADWSNGKVWGVVASSKEVGSVTIEDSPGRIAFAAP